MSFRSKFLKKSKEFSPKFLTVISRQKEGKTTAFTMLKEALLLDTQEGVKNDHVKIMLENGEIFTKDVYKEDIIDIASLHKLIEEIKAAPEEERFKVAVIDVLTDFVKPIMDMTLTNFMLYCDENERIIIEDKLKSAVIKAQENYNYLVKDAELLTAKIKSSTDPQEKEMLKAKKAEIATKYKNSVASSIAQDKVVIVESYPYGKIEKSLNSAFQEIKTLLASVFEKVIFSCHAVTKNSNNSNKFDPKEFDMHRNLKATIIAQSDAIAFGYRVGNNYILDFKSTSATSNAYGTRYSHLREKKVLLTELVDNNKSIFKHNWHIIYPDLYDVTVDENFIEKYKHCYTELEMDLGTTNAEVPPMG